MSYTRPEFNSKVPLKNFTQKRTCNKFPKGLKDKISQLNYLERNDCTSLAQARYKNFGDLKVN